MNPPFQVVPEVAEPPPVSLSVPYVYNADLHAEGEWYFSDISPSGEIDVRSNMQWVFSVIHDTCVESSVEAPKVAANFFKLVPRSLRTLGEQPELLAGLDRLHRTIRSSKAQIQ